MHLKKPRYSQRFFDISQYMEHHKSLHVSHFFRKCCVVVAINVLPSKAGRFGHALRRLKFTCNLKVIVLNGNILAIYVLHNYLVRYVSALTNRCMWSWITCPLIISTSFALQISRIKERVFSAIIPVSTFFLYFVIHTI